MQRPGGREGTGTLGEWQEVWCGRSLSICPQSSSGLHYRWVSWAEVGFRATSFEVAFVLENRSLHNEQCPPKCGEPVSAGPQGD